MRETSGADCFEIALKCAGIRDYIQNDMKPIRIVIDTNVLVSAFRSKQGASYALLSRLHERSFKISLSNAILLEYEEKLIGELRRQGRGDLESVHTLLDYLLTISDRCSVHGSLPVAGIHPRDQFVFDLAIASESMVIITFNLKHFRGAADWGISVMRPDQFLRLLENRR